MSIKMYISLPPKFNIVLIFQPMCAGLVWMDKINMQARARSSLHVNHLKGTHCEAQIVTGISAAAL